jgi:hypothetical protein
MTDPFLDNSCENWGDRRKWLDACERALNDYKKLLDDPPAGPAPEGDARRAYDAFQLDVRAGAESGRGLLQRLGPIARQKERCAELWTDYKCDKSVWMPGPRSSTRSQP